MGIEEEIRILEKGEDSALKDVLVSMSPGFRQKIALARALYYDPDIFILDDIFTEMRS